MIREFEVHILLIIMPEVLCPDIEMKQSYVKVKSSTVAFYILCL